MRQKARGLAQHGGLPGWLEQSDPPPFIICFDGQSMPPAPMDHTACPSLGMLSCELLVIPATVTAAAGKLLNVHNTLT